MGGFLFFHLEMFFTVSSLAPLMMGWIFAVFDLVFSPVCGSYIRGAVFHDCSPARF